MPRTAVLFGLAVVGVLLGPASGARAHDPGLSALELRVTGRELRLHLTFARREIEPLASIDRDRDGAVTAAELADARARLERLARDLIALAVDDRPLATAAVTTELDASDALHFRLSVPRPPGSRLRVELPVIRRLVFGHRHYASVRGPAGERLAERILDAEHSTLEVALTGFAAPTGSWRAFRQFLVLGVEHILTGWDHLLFLLGLLVVGGSLWRVAPIITAFTVAHSLTLTLATIDLVRVPSRVVEPLIALSIVYVGLENVLGGAPRRRWLLAFGFGLVHGLGFASVLRELGIGADGGGVVVPLLAFNVGVELGQVGIALLVVPLLERVRRLPWAFPRLVAACSVLVTAAGTYWLVARTLWG